MKNNAELNAHSNADSHEITRCRNYLLLYVKDFKNSKTIPLNENKMGYQENISGYLTSCPKGMHKCFYFVMKI